jgi:hypothetical protein
MDIHYLLRDSGGPEDRVIVVPISIKVGQCWSWLSPYLTVENAPEVILDQRSTLTSAFGTSGDFSYIGHQYYEVHFAEVD